MPPDQPHADSSQSELPRCQYSFLDLHCGPVLHILQFFPVEVGIDGSSHISRQWPKVLRDNGCPNASSWLQETLAPTQEPGGIVPLGCLGQSRATGSEVACLPITLIDAEILDKWCTNPSVWVVERNQQHSRHVLTMVHHTLAVSHKGNPIIVYGHPSCTYQLINPRLA